MASTVVDAITKFFSPSHQNNKPKEQRHFSFSSIENAISTSSQAAQIAKNPSAPSTPLSKTKITSSPLASLKAKSPVSSPAPSPSAIYPGPFTPRGSLVEYVSKFLSTPKNTSLSLESPYTSYKSPVHGPASSPYASYNPTDLSQPSSTVESMEKDAPEEAESSSPVSSPRNSTTESEPLTETSSSIEYEPLDFSKDPGPFSTTYDPSAEIQAPSRRSTIVTSTSFSPKNYPLSSPTKDSFLSAYASLLRTKPALSIDTQRPSMAGQKGGMNSGPFVAYVSPKGGMNSGPHGRWHHFSPTATPKSN